MKLPSNHPFLVLLVTASLFLTGCKSDIHDVPAKEYFKKDFQKNNYSGSLSLEEIDLVLAYRMKAISDPRILEDSTPLREIIEKMQQEMKNAAGR